jgi:hypothetical protein
MQAVEECENKSKFYSQFSFVEESEQKKAKILLSLIQPLLKNVSTNPNSNPTHAQTQIPTFDTHHDLFKNPRI